MKVTTIIVTYNALRNHWLHKCIGSLVNSGYPTDIIVVDNASTDDTVKIIKQQYPTINLIESEINLGFGGANNQGLKYALENGGEYFFLLNQDAWVEANTIEQLIYQLKINPEYGIVSPLHLNGEGSALDYNFSNYIKPDRCENLYSDFVLNQVKDTIYESGFICAAAWLLSKESLRIVGGFNPSFFHYGEDNNYVHRLHYKGLKIGVYPKTFIYHDRAFRKPSVTFDEKIEERRCLLAYSNPNQDVNHVSKLKQMDNKILKNYILMDFKTIKQLKHKKEMLKQIYAHTSQNLSSSKTKVEYLFLKS